MVAPGDEPDYRAAAGSYAPRLHFVVQPVLGEDLARYGVYGPVLQIALSDAGVVPDEAAVEAVCDRLRTELAANGQPQQKPDGAVP